MTKKGAFISLSLSLSPLSLCRCFQSRPLSSTSSCLFCVGKTTESRHTTKRKRKSSSKAEAPKSTNNRNCSESVLSLECCFQQISLAFSEQNSSMREYCIICPWRSLNKGLLHISPLLYINYSRFTTHDGVYESLLRASVRAQLESANVE